MEQFAEFLIQYIHAPLGGIALLSGGISLVSKKGSPLHKKSGKVFFYSMLLSAFSALVVSVLPNHKSPFLFSIGIFSSYFLISGILSLRYKRKAVRLESAPTVDIHNRRIYGYFSSGVSGDEYQIRDLETQNNLLDVETGHAAFRNLSICRYQMGGIQER